jgi:hypothetical protein
MALISFALFLINAVGAVLPYENVLLQIFAQSFFMALGLAVTSSLPNALLSDIVHGRRHAHAHEHRTDPARTPHEPRTLYRQLSLARSPSSPHLPYRTHCPLWLPLLR